MNGWRPFWISCRLRELVLAALPQGSVVIYTHRYVWNSVKLLKVWDKANVSPRTPHEQPLIWSFHTTRRFFSIWRNPRKTRLRLETPSVNVQQTSPHRNLYVDYTSPCVSCYYGNNNAFEFSTHSNLQSELLRDQAPPSDQSESRTQRRCGVKKNRTATEWVTLYSTSVFLVADPIACVVFPRTRACARTRTLTHMLLLAIMWKGSAHPKHSFSVGINTSHSNKLK